MKITDYTLVVAESADEMRLAVMAKVADGWEVHGGPLLLQKPVKFWQAMVKKFDPHEGQVWIKEPGFPGRWEKAT
jgi:hypothetical protein